MDTLNYGRLMQKAMRGLVAEVLAQTAETGLPGEHHFYITFQTNFPGVEIPDWLSERFPEEMVIVLQHEFHGLEVQADQFLVTLTFSDRPAELVVPFDAILQFADPSAEFGLRFDGTEPPEDLDEPAPGESIFRRRGETDAEDDAPKDGKTGEVVQLDTFRKK